MLFPFSIPALAAKTHNVEKQFCTHVCSIDYCDGSRNLYTPSHHPSDNKRHVDAAPCYRCDGRRGDVREYAGKERRASYEVTYSDVTNHVASKKSAVAAITNN